MAEDQKNMKSKFEGCCEGMPFAEIMEKMMAAKKAGSFNCAEMMKKIMGSQKGGCSFDCAQMMEKMKKQFGGAQ